MSYEPKKRCTKCREMKYEGDFKLQGRRLCSWCKECQSGSGRTLEESREYSRQYGIENKHIKLMCNARARSKVSGLAYDLDDYRDQIRARMYAGVCELTGLPLRYDSGNAATWNSPSIDRIKPELGYIYSNIRVVCHALNTAIGAWGEEQTAVLMQAWLDKRNEK